MANEIAKLTVISAAMILGFGLLTYVIARAMPGLARQGMARQAGHGMAWHGSAGQARQLNSINTYDQ